MIATKAQSKKLYNSNTGYGWLVFKSGDGEITEIEIYVGKDNKLRRVGNGQPLLPLCMCDDDEGNVLVS